MTNNTTRRDWGDLYHFCVSSIFWCRRICSGGFAAFTAPPRTLYRQPYAQIRLIRREIINSGIMQIKCRSGTRCLHPSVISMASCYNILGGESDTAPITSGMTTAHVIGGLSTDPKEQDAAARCRSGTFSRRRCLPPMTVSATHGKSRACHTVFIMPG